MARIPNEERKTLILTGASRGIGHATVKRFSSAGWRAITCSRHGFPEDCPWEAGPDDHIQVDLADPDNTMQAIAVMKERLKAQGGRLNALVNNGRSRRRTREARGSAASRPIIATGCRCSR
jgi:NAD(P)-dependent dehydrogenase (short-subunit alcohol dehydrogenase family)